MPTIVDRVRSAFSLNSNDTLHKQASDLRQQSLEIWRKAVAQAAAGKPIALLELQSVGLNLGITPGRLPSALEGDIAAWKAEAELAADAARAEEGNRKQTILAERAQKELLEIESRLLDVKRMAVSAHGSGMIAGQARANCDRHRNAHPRLWPDAFTNDKAKAEASLELPQEDTPPGVVAAKQSDEAEWIVDRD